MTLFYIDTTSSYLYTAIIMDNKILNQRKKDLGKNLSVETISIVNEMFNEVNVKPTDIDKIIVVNGPGSFTGIRVGVTIAKTMAFAKNKKISKISIKSILLKQLVNPNSNYAIIGTSEEDDNLVIDFNKESNLLIVGSKYISNINKFLTTIIISYAYWYNHPEIMNLETFVEFINNILLYSSKNIIRYLKKQKD